jgi:peptidoglycan/LPS O-acetylase OafA/YrhL
MTKSIKNITQYRTELMGVAILWIVFFHLPDYTKRISSLDSLIAFTQSIGYAGVDIFFFLSGFGLTFGWLRKKYTIPKFYQKRILRILPTYWVWMLLLALGELFITRDFQIRGFIADFFGIGFLSNRSYNHWFIPSIVICYLLFPFVINCIKKNDTKPKVKSFQVLLLSVIPPLLLSLCLLAIGANNLLIFSTRIPNFILGIFIAYLYLSKAKEDTDSNVLSVPILILMALMGSSLLYLTYTFTTPEVRQTYGLWWYPFIFLTYPLCIIFSFLLNWSTVNIADRVSAPFLISLKFCGLYSLEIYLMHGLLFNWLGYNKSNLGLFLIRKMGDSQIYFVIYYIFLILLSLISAYYLSRFMKVLLDVEPIRHISRAK